MILFIPLLAVSIPPWELFKLLKQIMHLGLNSWLLQVLQLQLRQKQFITSAKPLDLCINVTVYSLNLVDSEPYLLNLSRLLPQNLKVIIHIGFKITTRVNLPFDICKCFQAYLDLRFNHRKLLSNSFIFTCSLSLGHWYIEGLFFVIQLVLVLQKALL
jgi:hypothetical protein